MTKLVFESNWKHSDYERWFIVDVIDDHEVMFNQIKSKFDYESLTFVDSDDSNDDDSADDDSADESESDIYEYNKNDFDNLMISLNNKDYHYYPSFGDTYLFPVSYRVSIV